MQFIDYEQIVLIAKRWQCEGSYVAPHVVEQRVVVLLLREPVRILVQRLGHLRNCSEKDRLQTNGFGPLIQVGIRIEKVLTAPQAVPSSRRGEENSRRPRERERERPRERERERPREREPARATFAQ